MATRFASSTGALTACSWRPVFAINWLLANPSSCWAGEDVCLLIGTPTEFTSAWPHLPLVGVPIFHPSDDAELITGFLR